MHGPEPIEPNDFNALDFTDAELEAALAEALAPVEAPAGFAERVLARAAADSGQPAQPEQQPAVVELKPQPAKILRFPSRLRVLPAMGAIAAGLLVAAFTGYDLHERHEDRTRRATEATQQFDLATEITDRTVERAQQHAQQQAQEQLRRAGLRMDAPE